MRTQLRADVRQILRDSAVDLGDAGKDTEYGYGQIDVRAALDLALGSGGDDPTPPACSNNADCDDGDPCTADTCLNPGSADAVCQNLAGDCGGSEDPVCGDGTCAGVSLGEDCNSCPADCPNLGNKKFNSCCGDEVCGYKEDARNCPIDCQ